MGILESIIVLITIVGGIVWTRVYDVHCTLQCPIGKEWNRNELYCYSLINCGGGAEGGVKSDGVNRGVVNVEVYVY